MPLPLRRKRCSFGGKEGVWWRRKSTSTVVPTRDPSHSQPVMTRTHDNEKKVELDHALAHSAAVHHSSSCQNHVSSSSSSDESGDDNPLSFPLELERTKHRHGSLSTHLPKRRKTFGGQSRRPLSLLLSNENILFSSPTSREGETLVTERTSPDLELHLHQQQEDPPISRRSQPRAKHIDRQSNLDAAPPSNSVVSPFHFPSDNEPLDRWDTPQRPTATSSIQQARAYFAHLDAAHQLHIDSSRSPSPCRPITRTTRKVQLSSPGFVNEYTQYARASRELGVTPLPTKEYAQSRRKFFRKAELFNGFVDC